MIFIETRCEASKMKEFENVVDEKAKKSLVGILFSVCQLIITAVV